MAASRTVDWQLVQAPSRITPPAAATMGAAVEATRPPNAAGHVAFIHPKTRRTREVREPGLGPAGYLREAVPAATSSRSRCRMNRLRTGVRTAARGTRHGIEATPRP